MHGCVCKVYVLVGLLVVVVVVVVCGGTRLTTWRLEVPGTAVQVELLVWTRQPVSFGAQALGVPSVSGDTMQPAAHQADRATSGPVAVPVAVAPLRWRGEHGPRKPETDV